MHIYRVGTAYTCIYIHMVPAFLLKSTKVLSTLNCRSGERRSCRLSLLSRFRIMNPWLGEDTLGDREEREYMYHKMRDLLLHYL